jgi:hypothetical protein
VPHYEHQVIDRGGAVGVDGGAHPAVPVERASRTLRAGFDERAARATLREQIARLERERSQIVAERFPFILAPAPVPSVADGPAILGLGELERVRDQLVRSVHELRTAVRQRDEHERRAHEQLRRMRCEPRRHKFARLPVRDLGTGVCGVWEVRPRLGLIGMLAGWWQVKLSSGCPLARGSRSTRGPGSQR